MGYVVSKAGTFGAEERRYRTYEGGVEVVLIAWGPLRWLTPVLASDVIVLQSQYESEARAETERRLGSM